MAKFYWWLQDGTKPRGVRRSRGPLIFLFDPEVQAAVAVDGAALNRWLHLLKVVKFGSARGVMKNVAKLVGFLLKFSG